MPGKILIIDGIATNRISLRVRLSGAYYEVVQASSGTEAMTLLDSARPDIVLVSATLPDLCVFTLCQAIRNAPLQGDLPIVVLDADTCRTRRKAALAAGADDVLDRNAPPKLLLARLRSLMRHVSSHEDRHLHSSARASAGFAEKSAPYAPQPHVALVSNDTAPALTLMKRLQQQRPYQFSLHSTRSLPLGMNQQGAPDVFVICAEAGKTDEIATSLLATLGAQPGLRRCKFLMALPALEDDTAARLLDLGAHALMTGTLDTEEAALQLDNLLRRKAQSDQLHVTLQNGLRAALIDPLTGLHNRRYAMPELSRLLHSAASTGQSLAVLLADLDHFKQLNDRHGHSAGDAVLTEVSHRLRSVLRPQDLLARYGGEEFLIALPGLCTNEARGIADRLRQAIGQNPVLVTGLPGGGVPVTVSIGMTLFDAKDRTPPCEPAHFLALADRALYRAKAHGRNQVTALTRPAA